MKHEISTWDFIPSLTLSLLLYFSGPKWDIGSVWIEFIVAENWKLKTENTVAK